MERNYFFSFLNFCLCPGMLKAFCVHFMGRTLGKKNFPQRLTRMNLLPVIGNCKDIKFEL